MGEHHGLPFFNPNQTEASAAHGRINAQNNRMNMGSARADRKHRRGAPRTALELLKLSERDCHVPIESYSTFR
jgi:hypothetical protein